MPRGERESGAVLWPHLTRIFEGFPKNPSPNAGFEIGMDLVLHSSELVLSDSAASRISRGVARVVAGPALKAQWALTFRASKHDTCWRKTGLARRNWNVVWPGRHRSRQVP